MTDKEALKLALEALETCESGKVIRAINTIREALAEPQEKYRYGTPLLDAMTGKAEQPAQQKSPSTRRWNIERDGDALLVCDGLHDKHEPCEYKRYVPEPAQQQEPVALAQEVIGCFHAAEIEGLTAALANTTDEHLKDLVERRLMYALYAAQEVERNSK